MAKRRKVSNLLALSLLTLLTERPMYPYEMASKLRERGKDNAIKINWGSFYTVVQNLELLSVPEREHTRFEAALGDSAVLPPDELIDLLQQRLAALEEANGRLQADLAAASAQIPRLFLIESEFYLAQRRAEEEWVRELLKEFTSGTFPGWDAWRRFRATGEVPEEIQALIELEGGGTPDT
jgi:hypothetical protein